MTATGDDAARLAGYIDVWWQACDDFTTLLEEVPAEQWSAPTDLPGWDVHAVVAHTAHLEAVLAGAPEETVAIGEPAHVRGVLGAYTEQGVVARRDRAPDELITEIRESTTRRHTALLADPPTDAGASPSGSSAAFRGPGSGCCATGRWTCGCTSRTYGARSGSLAASTPRRPGTPRTTSSRASTWWSASGSLRRPAPRWCSR